MEYMEKYHKWSNTEIFDEETKRQLLEMRDNEQEIKDSFYKDLEFGTAGLRGVVGVGTAKMNKYTVGKASQGLANYIVKKGFKDRGIVIGYDSRNSSPEFCQQTALILCANGIKTYVFNEPRPLPELSFAIRELGTISGVMITASHNPPKYNGYKVFWEDGSQIVYPIDEELTKEINSVNYEGIKTILKEQAIEIGLYTDIGNEMDDKYVEALKKLSLNQETIKQVGESLKIVYTPLHGAGGIIAEKALKEYGFTDIYIVPEQEKPDGNFPTVGLPNPEEPEAFDMALKLAKRVDRRYSCGKRSRC